MPVPVDACRRCFKAAVLQLYTIDDGELVHAVRVVAIQARRAHAAPRINMAIFRGISTCCDFYDTRPRKHDNSATLGTTLANSDHAIGRDCARPRFTRG